MDLPVAIKYKDEIYLCYKLVDNRAHLINKDGHKYPGTPIFELTRMQVVGGTFLVREFNKHKYVKTKLGIFSMTTGSKVAMKEILDLFK